MTDTTPMPCPFCGGEAAITSTLYGYPASHWVKCGNCGACSTNYSNRGSALTAWNTRANADARLVEALEEARTALSITRTNVMTEIGRCSDESRSPWAGVPEQLAKRIAKIDAALSEVSRG